MNILVTGGAGYVGSHTLIELLNDNHEVVVVDNLSNGSREAVKRVEEITGKDIEFHEIDLKNKEGLEAVFDTHAFDAVLHFAGFKSPAESLRKALHYYHNNLKSTLTLLEVMEKFNVKKLIFSSSAAVYGTASPLGVVESASKTPTNPYGQTKLMIEQILEDVSRTNEGWNITSLRYFNPIGSHDSGRIGEDPKGVLNNLLPYVTHVATGKLSTLNVLGGDYETPDGTCVRDYIHVVDLAQAHLAALEHLDHPNIYKAYNVGSGKGVSVLELVAAFERSTGQKVPYEIVARRPGDVAICYADPTLANRELNWKAKLSLDDACRSAWKWQSQNPDGFQTI